MARSEWWEPVASAPFSFLSRSGLVAESRRINARSSLANHKRGGWIGVPVSLQRGALSLSFPAAVRQSPSRFPGPGWSKSLPNLFGNITMKKINVLITATGEWCYRTFKPDRIKARSRAKLSLAGLLISRPMLSIIPRLYRH